MLCTTVYRRATYPANLNYEADAYTGSSTQSSSGFLDWPNQSTTWTSPSSWSVGDDDFKSFNRNTNEVALLYRSITIIK